MVVTSGDPGAFARLVKILSAGGIAIIPCDTIYGIVGAAPGTEARIRAVKGRGETQPFLQLIADASWVARFSDAGVPPSLARYWPGPLTIVLPARSGGTIALRVPDSPFLHDLLAALDQPLFSTSVNRSGKPALNDVDAIAREFESDVDLVVDGGSLPGGKPSTLVDATTRPMKILRQGALQIPPQELR